MKAQEKRLNITLALGFTLLIGLAFLAFRPIKYTEIPELNENVMTCNYDTFIREVHIFKNGEMYSIDKISNN